MVCHIVWVSLCSQYGLVCALWYSSVIVIASFFVPILASLSTSSFLVISLCALTLCIYIMRCFGCLWVVISCKSNLSVGCDFL
jgi:hypothetical protein